MRVDIGPVSSTSARAWLDYAAETLERLRTVDDPKLPARVLDAFADLLDTWRPYATGPGPFRWSGDEPSERVQFLLYGLYTAGLVTEQQAAAGHARLRPAEADEFHFVLVREVHNALEHESDADAHFAKTLRDVWDIASDY